MVDSIRKDKMNISLPARLQSPQVWDSESEEEYPLIINMQKAMYEALINDLEERKKR